MESVRQRVTQSSQAAPGSPAVVYQFRQEVFRPPDRPPGGRSIRHRLNSGHLWSQPPAIIAIILAALLLISSVEGILRTEAERLLRLRTNEANSAIPARINILPDAEPLLQIPPPSPSGNVRASAGSQTRESWAGESRDSNTGLTNLRARDYDPLTGRFTTADSQSPNGSFTQGYNAYHYTDNNPTSRTDPSGHNWLDGIGTAGGQERNWSLN